MAEGYHDFAAGEPLTAANLEDYCEAQSIMRFASAAARDTALSTIKTEGMFAYLKDVNTLTVYTGTAWSTIGPVLGALTTWTPTLTQSASVSLTSTTTYQRVGRQVTVNFRVSITSTGTGSNAVISNLPVNAALTSNHVVGSGYLFDASTSTSYPMHVVIISATQIEFYNLAGTYGPLGSNVFIAALAAGDGIDATFTYEAAGDA